MVLLGLRTALRKDSDYSLTQMVYEKTIKLPGEFFDAPKISTTPETFLHKLQKQMESLKPKLTRHNTSPKIFVFKDLETCSHVFLKTCRVRKSLEPAYEGPFKVTSRTDKYFSIEIKGREINVSIDRLKPAYILKEEEDIATTPGVAGDPRLATPGEDKEPSASAAPKMSRSGRTIRTPVRFRDKVECYPAYIKIIHILLTIRPIRAHNSNKWTESIPTVVLGLRTALRKDSDYSLTQMVYGKTIKLPGEFFDAPKISTTPETFLHKLQKQMESLKPKVRKSLEPAYEGPFKVTSRTDKYFSIEIKGKEINVSIDRLKPAYILKEEEDIATTPGVAGDPRLAPPGEDKEPSASAAPKMSRSGRTIRTPVRFRDKVECYPG
ncbi:hypothetical protein LAZ67_21000580 [Cordylochernes scorpioides]|uniref:Uncharacterized protein n=1 Tax=Cordylochernes scorpioides TaxID=51811 RepID=A0ABY6LLI4_9ARAC|nr:hypothetical protein LAZ67_21000580 [Cordylochernes scorpioides]